MTRKYHNSEEYNKNNTNTMLGDDATLFAESESDLERLSHRFAITASIFNTSIFIKKHVIAKEASKCQLVINNKIQ